MACPACGCKETYSYDEGDSMLGGDETLERCAACGFIFDVEDHAYEDDEEDGLMHNSCHNDLDQVRAAKSVKIRDD